MHLVHQHFSFKVKFAFYLTAELNSFEADMSRWRLTVKYSTYKTKSSTLQIMMKIKWIHCVFQSLNSCLKNDSTCCAWSLATHEVWNENGRPFYQSGHECCQTLLVQIGSHDSRVATASRTAVQYCSTALFLCDCVTTCCCWWLAVVGCRCRAAYLLPCCGYFFCHFVVILHAGTRTFFFASLFHPVWWPRRPSSWVMWPDDWRFFYLIWFDLFHILTQVLVAG